MVLPQITLTLYPVSSHLTILPSIPESLPIAILFSHQNLTDQIFQQQKGIFLTIFFFFYLTDHILPMLIGFGCYPLKTITRLSHICKTKHNPHQLKYYSANFYYKISDILKTQNIV